MTERGIGRSALLAGLLVLVVLVGGRMAGTLHNRQAGHLTSSSGRGGTASNQTTTKPKAQPAPTTSAGGSASDTRGSAAKSGNGSGLGSKDNPMPTPNPSGSPSRSSAPSDRALGAKRTTGATAVALTFDDGPSPDWTPQVLDLLRERGVKATFCLVGTQVRKYPQLVARIVREGHTLCNHSWHHDLELGSRPDEVIRSDLTRTSAEIHQAVPGAGIAYYRQPGGKWTPAVISIAKELGMAPLDWAVDPQDWNTPGTQAIIDRVMHSTHRGSIVLMHDGGGDRSETLAACKTLIPWLQQRYPLVALR
jgi:peptidoglycan/xylan/chitin deacetylase (PgdA/CDA1 family)